MTRHLFIEGNKDLVTFSPSSEIFFFSELLPGNHPCYVSAGGSFCFVPEAHGVLARSAPSALRLLSRPVTFTQFNTHRLEGGNALQEQLSTIIVSKPCHIYKVKDSVGLIIPLMAIV